MNSGTAATTRAGRAAVVIALVAGLLTVGAPGPVSAAPVGTAAPAASAPHEDSTVLVGFELGTSDGEKAAAIASVGARLVEIVGVGTHVLDVGSGRVASTIEALQSRPEVRYAEPDYLVSADAAPNDPALADLWGLQRIAAPLAWDHTTGSSDVVIGVVDTGVDYTHPDLAANMWTSDRVISGCLPFVTHGFDAVNDDCDPIDDEGHGTHVSGTIGAVGNNGAGVVGVNWNARIMALKFLGADGSGTTSDAIQAIDWAVDAKKAGVNIRALNNSWGGGGFSQALLDEINAARANDILFVAAAGNDATNNDTRPMYPCSYSAANIVCVAASTETDDRAWFSNWGRTSVHLAAPGVGILSTVPGAGYDAWNGTSMAAPHVTGAAALALAQGYLSVADLKEKLLRAVDPLPAFADLVVSGGRLNVCRLTPACPPAPPPPPPPPVPGPPQNLQATGHGFDPTKTSGARVDLIWEAPTTDGGSRIREYRIYRDVCAWGDACAGYVLLGRVSGNSRKFSDKRVENYDGDGMTLVYAVAAVNEHGEGRWSNSAIYTTPCFWC